MTILLMCSCGCKMSLADDLAGTKVPCTQCGRRFNVPSAGEDARFMRWHCQCGQRLKARARAAGKAISCPACGSELTVPMAPLSEDNFAPDFDIIFDDPDDLDSDTDTDSRGVSDHTLLDEDDSSHNITDQPSS